MLGAIIGDIVGSRFEFVDHEGKDFELFTNECKFTDDTLMTLAIARSLILSEGNYEDLAYRAELSMKEIAHRYPNVNWGMRFYNWLFKGAILKDSYGNGAAMRISPVAWVANSEDELMDLTKRVTKITHGHPEGIKGAESVALAIYLSRIGKDKNYIRERLINYYPQLKYKGFNIKTIMGSYGYDPEGLWVTCQGSVPQALVAFLDSENFEDAIRNAIGVGGDSDTIGAITGSIAEAYYGIPDDIVDKSLEYLPVDLKGIFYAFNTIKIDKKIIIEN